MKSLPSGCMWWKEVVDWYTYPFSRSVEWSTARCRSRSRKRTVVQIMVISNGTRNCG